MNCIIQLKVQLEVQLEKLVLASMLPPLVNSNIAAPAKINLSLEIWGRRADGYHELSSLVVFSEFADELIYDASANAALTVTGEFASALDGENLIEKAAQLLKDKYPDISLGAVELTKNIPVAAGLGGGSSDVAAYLNLIKAHNSSHISASDIDKLAASLGADVPVCLAGTPYLMQGIGEVLTPLQIIPQIHIVMVNCGAKLSTREVFEALNAPQRKQAELEEQEQTCQQAVLNEDFHTVEQLVRFLQHHPNDLTLPALSLEPQIGLCLQQLERQEGCTLARMSGSGATCFGLYKDAEAAEAGARDLKQLFPHWWVKKSCLLPAPSNS